jgi:hypothetical protein
VARRQPQARGNDALRPGRHGCHGKPRDRMNKGPYRTGRGPR